MVSELTKHHVKMLELLRNRVTDDRDTEEGRELSDRLRQALMSDLEWNLDYEELENKP